eukprot:Em0002g856a
MDSGNNEQSNREIPYLEGLDQKKEKGRGAFGAVFEVKLNGLPCIAKEGMRAKIADLGMSKLFDIQWLQRQSGQTVQPGAPAYMPPEALAQTPSYDLKLDIFSFGALMLYTATQEFPTVYELSVNDFTKDAMKNHTIQILKRKCWIDKMGEDHPFRSLVLQCLQDRPEARPTAKVLCEDISSICCRYKKEWKNILELHSQLQTSSSNNEKLRSSIIELQKSNAELEQVRNGLNSNANDANTISVG